MADLPAGVTFSNDSGEVGVLSGKVELPVTRSTLATSWATRFHPLRSIWVSDELRQRASYLATRRHLVPFLVPHRFEGKEGTQPSKLNRSRFAYAVGLNKAYLQEIFGHIRSTTTHYSWGPLGAPDDEDIIQPPSGDPAKTLWWDCTGDGVTWKNFFEGKALEWMLSSVGGFILVDSNRPEGVVLTQRLAEDLGIRTRVKWIPMSWVEDLKKGPNGYEWIKLAETSDQRGPRSNPSDSGFQRRHVLYELLPDGRTRISRVDDDGKSIGPTVFQKVVDDHGRPRLPLEPVKFGEHPDAEYLGSGLLMGLDDIVIDLFNLLTEIRESFRDAAFGFLTYQGPDGENVRNQLSDGTRLVNLGDDGTAALNRVAADGSEVGTGLELFDVGLKNWSLSAKRRAMEVMDASSSRSGMSLKAEFQLDLRPLLVSVCETLDAVETNVMALVSQIEGFSVEEAFQCEVVRETEFRLEEEASRIARIVQEFLSAIPAMPAALMKKMIMRWASSIDFLKLDEPLEDGSSMTLGEKIDQEAEEIADSEQKAHIQKNEGMAGLGALGDLGSLAGGNNDGGGAQPDTPGGTRRSDGAPTPNPTGVNGRN